jgi:hypothetical protein
MQIGQALRLALHDGLHRSVSDEVVGSDLAGRCSNTWWAMCVLDQEITAGLGCPPAVPQNNITTPLPIAFSSSVSAKALALRTRLSRLVSSISNCMGRLSLRQCCRLANLASTQSAVASMTIRPTTLLEIRQLSYTALQSCLVTLTKSHPPLKLGEGSYLTCFTILRSLTTTFVLMIPSDFCILTVGL